MIIGEYDSGARLRTLNLRTSSVAQQYEAQSLGEFQMIEYKMVYAVCDRTIAIAPIHLNNNSVFRFDHLPSPTEWNEETRTHSNKKEKPMAIMMHLARSSNALGPPWAGAGRRY